MISKAIANNDLSLIFWSCDKKIDNCLGFSIIRKDQETGLETPLPAWVGFKNQSNQAWQPKDTNVWPIQKFNWGDFTAKRGKTYTYKIIPLIGTPDNLLPHPSIFSVTNPVTVSPGNGNFKAYFNRGILSTQSLAHQVPSYNSGPPNYKTLIDRMDQPGDTLRNSLAGQLRDALMLLMNRANDEGGHCYCALYELNDPELIELILKTKNVHIILSNTGPDDQTNRGARQTLHDAGIDVYDRMLSGSHIGHNKLVVYADSSNTPKAVLTGSTNWTYTGLCAQSNNALIIESEDVAKLYMNYWQRLKADDAKQSSEFRTENDVIHNLNSQLNLDVCFSPNTKQKTKPKNPKTPDDMGEIFSLMESAEKSIIFLAFQPGLPSIIDKAAECQAKKPQLFIRGAVTDPKAVENYNVKLVHQKAQHPDTVVAASAINDQFGYWQKELLKSSPTAHAIIHDKIVVIDSFTEKCAVITGSHNLGYTASYANDENIVIVKGNTELSQAYTTHVMDIYDHYRWRYIVEINQGKKKTFFGLETNDKWQNKYYNPKGYDKNALQFWQ